MADTVLLAKQINHGQSELWLEAAPASLRIVATNGIVYPIRTQCSAEVSQEFHKAFEVGVAVVPQSVVAILLKDFRMGA